MVSGGEVHKLMVGESDGANGKTCASAKQPRFQFSQCFSWEQPLDGKSKDYQGELQIEGWKWIGSAESLTEWITINMKTMSASTFCLLLVICWRIWESRNQKVWNRSSPALLLHATVVTANNKDMNITGLWFLLRNHEGKFLAAKEQKWRGIFQSREAEAISEALKWLKVLKVDNVQVESDALLVIQSQFNFIF
nr:uncharacterized protein LOC109189292 [Ipomoea batatas]